MKNQEIDPEINNVVALLNKLEKVSAAVAIANQQLSAVSADFTVNFNKKFEDYVIKTPVLPLSFYWLKEQMRRRKLPGMIDQTQEAYHYSTPGTFMNEYDDHAGIRTSKVEIILKSDDTKIYNTVLQARIDELNADKGLTNAQKNRIKVQFLAAASDKNLIKLFNLKANLLDRSANDIQMEAVIAVELSRNSLVNQADQNLTVSHKLSDIFAQIDALSILSDKDRLDYTTEAAQRFVTARHLKSQLSDMGLTIAA